MNESTNNPAEFERGFAEAERQFGPEIEHLRKELEYYKSKAEADNVTPEVEELRKALDQANKSQDNWYNAHAKQLALIADTEEYLKEQYAGTMDEETRELIVEVLRRLGCETTREIDVTITATWYGSIEVPLDYDDAADLEANMPWNSEPEVSLGNTILDGIFNIDETTIDIS